MSTIQKLGGVIASAVIGALLQHRLATALHAQAVRYEGTAQLPPPVRGPFVASFNVAAKAGFDVGRGQTGGTLHVPAGLPDQVIAQIERLAAAVFTHSYVDAMRPTLLLPIALVLLAAGLTIAVRARAGQPEGQAVTEPAREPVPVA